MIQIDSSNESHIVICYIQCNFNNVLTKPDFIKLNPDGETGTETESCDERKQKWTWDEKQKQKLVIQIDGSYESSIFICPYNAILMMFCPDLISSSLSLIRKWRRKQKWKWDKKRTQKLVIQIDSSYESHMFICSIQCNFNNVLTQPDFIKLNADMESEPESESHDEQKRKRDEDWKQKDVIQIDSSYESNILICSIQCNFNNVLPKSDFIKVEPDMETETKTEMEMEMETGQKTEMETCDTN